MRVESRRTNRGGILTHFQLFFASHHPLPSCSSLSSFKDACSLLAGCLPGDDHGGFVGGVSLRGTHSASSLQGDVVFTVSGLVTLGLFSTQIGLSLQV